MSETPGWVFRKEVSIGDVFAFGSAALAVVYAFSTLDKRVTILEQAAIIQKDTDRRQDEESIRNQVRLEEVLKSMDAKIERLIIRTRP